MEVSRNKKPLTQQLQAPQRNKPTSKESMMADAFKDKTADKAKVAAAKSSAPKPVVNGQNQVIGSRLNVSA
jgi:hypothetical protein